MTEFDLGGATLGLMPAADMEALLSGQIRAGAGQRCELYLRRSDEWRAPLLLHRIRRGRSLGPPSQGAREQLLGAGSAGR
jgi:hypothetical protein